VNAKGTDAFSAEMLMIFLSSHMIFLREMASNYGQVLELCPGCLCMGIFAGEEEAESIWRAFGVCGFAWCYFFAR